MSWECWSCSASGPGDDRRFCSRCGTELWQAAPPPAAHGRRAAVVGAVVVVLLALTGVAAWAGGMFASGPEPTPDPPIPTTTAVASPTSAYPTTSSQTSSDDTIVIRPAAASHPDAATVRSGLDAYYAAINTHDYDAWVAAVLPEVARNQSRQGWLTGYRSTTDDHVTVNAIATDPSSGNLLADVSMRSTQDPDDGPPSMKVATICWTLTLPVDSTSGRVGSAVRGGTSMRAC